MLIHTKFRDVDTIIWQCVHLRIPNVGDTYIQQQLTKITSKTFVSPSRNSSEKKKENEKKNKKKQECQLQRFLRYEQMQ